MTYTIKVNYTTGNSFGSEEETSQVNLVWESKDLARKALKSLANHYKTYRKYDGSRFNITIEELRSHDWFKPELWGNSNNTIKEQLNYWEYSCHVEVDDGSYRTLDCGTWIGYFETLHSAKIVLFDGLTNEDEVHF